MPRALASLGLVLTVGLSRGAARAIYPVAACGINPGDSGGPLLDDKGELVAVTFAIPKGGTDQGISLDNFAYHVHLEEGLQAFYDTDGDGAIDLMISNPDGKGRQLVALAKGPSGWAPARVDPPALHPGRLPSEARKRFAVILERLAEAGQGKP